MAEPAAAHLLDTNVLLRLAQPKSLEFGSVRSAIRSLHRTQAPLYYLSQNLIEFWNVSTRPVGQNGHGLSPAETEDAARRIEQAFVLLPEVEAIHNEWRRLEVKYGVSGAKVHDARLVVAMMVYGVRHILTLNGRDFERYTEIMIVHPGDIPA